MEAFAQRSAVDALPAVDAFGPDARLHHVGVAVKSIAAVRPDLMAVHDPIQKVRVAFFRLHDLTIELIEPAADDAPVHRSLRAGSTLVHTCFEVDDVDAALVSGRRAGYAMLRPPVPAVAFANRRIAWVMHRAFGLVELLERRSAESAE